MVVAAVQAHVSFFQSAPYGEPALPVHTERNERAPLRIGDLVVFGARVTSLRNTTPVLASADTKVWILYYFAAGKVRVRDKVGGT